MRTTFDRFDKILFLKVHRYTIVYYVTFNCGSLTKSSLILEDLFLKVHWYAISWFLIFNCGPLIWVLIFESLFSRSSFYDIAYFSILASWPQLDATITSENFFRSFSIDAIIFNCGPYIMDASLVLQDVFGRSEISLMT